MTQTRKRLIQHLVVAFWALTSCAHVLGQNPIPAGSSGNFPLKSSDSSQATAPISATANTLPTPRKFNPFLWSEVSRDDAQTGSAPHLKRGTTVNLTTALRVYRAFSNWQALEFSFSGLDPGADYRLKIEFPAGKTIGERSVKFPPGDVRTQKVFANDLAVAENIKVGQTSPFTRDFILPKKAYQSGTMLLRIQSDMNAVVSSLVLSSNASGKLPANSDSNKGTTAPPQILDSLVEPQSWKNPFSPAKGWNPLGKTGEEECFYSDAPFLFGGAAGHYAQVRTKSGLLSRVEIVLAEQSHIDLDGVQAQSARKLQWNQSKAWKSNLKEAEEKISAFLRVKFGEPRPVILGRGTPLSADVLQYASSFQPICVRVKRTPIILEVTIEPRSAAENTTLLRADWPSDQEERSQRLQSTVEFLPNGDHRIQLIGCQQLGPYCAMGTLAMVANHMGVSLNVFDFAAQAGYDIIPRVDKKHKNVHEGLAEATRSIYHTQGQAGLNAAQIASLIDSGIPIICYRFMSWKRMKKHQELANRVPLLPPEDLDKENWPKANDPNNKDLDYHASLITGYNPERREAILSESWGVTNLNAERIRIEEILATTNTFFWWTPK